MKRYYNIADLTIEMDTFGRTEEQAYPYQIGYVEKPDIVIRSNLEKARRTFPNLSESDWEYMASGANFYRNLIQYNGFMLHSSAVVVKEKAYLFTADSGVGKSTHTRNWLSVFGDEAHILNDDKPALRQVDGIWYAYGTPWSGKHDISKNERVEIEGIAVVERSEKNTIEPISGVEAVKELLKQASKPNDYVLRGKVMELLGELISQVPIWRLKCTQEKEAAVISYKKMSERRGDRK